MAIHPDSYWSFLSCLCGRELVNAAVLPLVVFLSCLCGRELDILKILALIIFLSCLCGREPSYY